MKNVIKLLVVLATFIVPFQTGCAQSKPCPSNNKDAEQVMKRYLSKEVNIKSLRDSYNMTIDGNAPKTLQSVSGKNFKKECRQLKQHLAWLKKEKHYSIYKLDQYYFIVLYTYAKDSTFKVKETVVINDHFKVVGSIIHF